MDSQDIFTYEFDVSISQHVDTDLDFPQNDGYTPNRLTIANFTIDILEPTEETSTSELYAFYNCPSGHRFLCYYSQNLNNTIDIPDGLAFVAFDIYNSQIGNLTIGNTKLFIINLEVFDGTDGHFMDPQTDIYSDESRCKFFRIELIQSDNSLR